MTRAWLDDERPAPPGWTHYRWPAELVAAIQAGGVTEVSLDHDLGDDARGTGYDVLAWLEDAVVTGRLPASQVPAIAIHTANPPARDRMLAAARNIWALAGGATDNEADRRRALDLAATYGVTNEIGHHDPLGDLDRAIAARGTVTITVGGTELRSSGGAPMAAGGFTRPLDAPAHVFIHEAGHAVVAHALGLQVFSIRRFATYYETAFEGPEESPTEHFLHAVVCLAGGAAQQHAGVAPDHGCYEDLQLAVGSILVYLGEDPDEVRGALDRGDGKLPVSVDPAIARAGALAMDIVVGRWTTVESVAAALKHAGELDEDALAGLLGGGA